MRGTVFYKMTGSGNDFVVLDGRSSPPELWSPAQVKAICDRRNGVGADGLVVLSPCTGEMVRMTYWNSDGSHGALCGNAALCSARLAVQLELVPPGEFCLQSDAGPIRVNSPAQVEEAEINLPDLELPGSVEGLKLQRGESWMAFITVGVPHLVVRVRDSEGVDVPTRGRQLRFDPRLGRVGANVNFVCPQPEPASPWLIRTYERGVEGETLACGTGTVAAALAVAAKEGVKLPLRFRSRGGPELVVRGQLSASGATDVWLGGEGRLLFRGVWDSQ